MAVIVSCCLLPAVGVARTWIVRPDSTGDAPTIQAALDSARAGDEVLLAPGTYTWSTQGHDGDALDPSMIRMRAAVTLRGAGGAAATILDAESRGRVLLCEDVLAARIESITFRGGTTAVALGGGGILVRGDSRPTIAGCIVRDNTTGERGGGAGLRCDDAEIRDCRFLDNVTGQSGFGGGIACLAAQVSNCVLVGNGARGGDAGGGQGGGLWSRGATVSDCWFESNSATGTFGAAGGGVYEAGNGSITSCTFFGNTATGTAARGLGGGAHVGPGAQVRGCTFAHNLAAYGSGSGLGGGIYCRTGAAVAQCTLVGNSSGVHVSTGVVVTTTIVASSAREACTGSDATWTCSDLFGNGAGDDRCGNDGGGNLSADPQFCAVDPAASLDFDLQQDSPCAPGNHPEGACDGIGARTPGCGSVSVRASTWGRVKSLYRD